uniref:ATP-dependent RecD2 DNA helicase n=1 Tax=Candidatus Kentrum sp. TUN TaxID=2126343 RepID=A0A450ZZH9_9GAMM|nr:MAG: exodeoxyribonuclease V alpha subunit [Candidatus Kentron sp. TUN]VFK59156.1 MAG: exodeoxyribonuclease V alpha subunit [Candidatus Kentron sp. TUN]VFK62951.1 MAG: exodeoxyribonuclease V alpha subunit [Candidatus Kentron sp. TUN]
MRAPKTTDSAEKHAFKERLSGAVARITFHNSENGFCVLRIKVPGVSELVTVTGTVITVSPGEYVECQGHWVNDPTHGRQFSAVQLQVVPPSTREGIERYLGSGMVRGIGPHFARKLVQAFGERVFEIIENEPERLTELPGVGPLRKTQIVTAWAGQRAIREIMVFLRSYGLGTARAVRIFKTYGNDAIERVRENPYRLATDIHGMGFATADTLAQRLGIPSDSPMRARAGILHILQTLSVQGHCAWQQTTLITDASTLLSIPHAIIKDAIDAEVREKRLVLESIGNRSCVFLAALWNAEVNVVNHIRRLLRYPSPWGRIHMEKAASWVEKKTNLALSDSQRQAVFAALNGKVTVITGGPGVGKTTVVNSILQILRAKGANPCLCAPTGRAAKRLSESTGFAASTIHRALEFDPRIMGFKRQQNYPLETDLVILDEASMVDVALMNRFLCAIPNRAVLLMVGDVDQLPSIGPGSVLADMITSSQITVVRLTEIFRQAAASQIVANAHLINQGITPQQSYPKASLSDFYVVAADSPETIRNKLLQIVTQRIPQRFGLHPIRDLQVLTPTNRGPLGTQTLNTELQRHLNPNAIPTVTRFGWTLAPGDKVVQRVNNYDKDTFNGDVGYVLRVNKEESELIVDMDGREVSYTFDELDELSLAYAMTIHKAQGSEYPAVVVLLASQHYTLLARNLLYTAITRGRQLVVVICQMQALSMAVKNTPSAHRLTKLAERLNHSPTQLE